VIQRAREESLQYQNPKTPKPHKNEIIKLGFLK
jgi:hypothetical protein